MNDNIDKWDLIYKNKKWDSEFPERCIQDFYKYYEELNKVKGTK